MIGCIGNKATDAVVLFQKSYGTTGLSREQPHSLPILLVALDQLAQLAELVGVGRYRPARQIKAVGMLVVFLQLGEIKAASGIGQGHGRLDAAVEGRKRQP